MNARPIVATRLPQRGDLTRATVIRQGNPLKGDLFQLDLGQGRILVKDYRNKPAWARLLGRIQIRREHDAYRWLGEMPGIPRYLGRIDAHALAVEWIDGGLLCESPDRRTEALRYLAELRDVMDRMHRSGLAHLDLRSNKNVMLRTDRSICVVDLASAACMRPGGLAHRLFFRWFATNDLTGALKWKQVLMAGPLTDEEWRMMQRHRRFRKLWLFNPKRPI